MGQETKLQVSASPHVRAELTTARMMLDVIIALIPVAAAAAVLFRWQALRVPAKVLDLSTEVASIGTMVEYGFAHAYHTPIIAIMREKSVHRHVFPLGISLEIVPDLDTGLFLARKLLNLPEEPVLVEGEEKPE